MSESYIGLPGGYYDSDNDEAYEDDEFYGLTADIPPGFQSGFEIVGENETKDVVADPTPPVDQYTWLTKSSRPSRPDVSPRPTRSDSSYSPVLVEETSGNARALKQLTLVDDFRLAIQAGDLVVIQRFLDRGVSTGTVFSCGVAPLSIAAAASQPAAMQLLLTHGAQLSPVTEGMFPVLCSACAVSSSSSEGSSDDVAQCVTILLEAGADANVVDSQGMSALSHAARTGQTSAARLLVEAGASVSNVDNLGYTILMRAVEGGMAEMVGFLVRVGADVTHRAPDGMTAKLLASRSHRLDITTLLDNAGALPSVGPETEAATQTHDDNEVTSSSVDDDVVDNVSRFAVNFSGSSMPDELALLLSVLDLRDLIPIFRRNDVTLEQLLRYNDENLTKLGIEHLPTRKKILDAVRDTHRRVWETASLPSISYDRKLSCADVIALIRNVERQIRLISSTIGYVSDQSGDSLFLSQQKDTGSSGKAGNVSRGSGNTKNGGCENGNTADETVGEREILLGNIEESITNTVNLYTEVTRLKTRLNMICKHLVVHKPDLITHQMALKYTGRRFSLTRLVTSALSFLSFHTWC